jgi:hypothetical protein
LLLNLLLHDRLNLLLLHLLLLPLFRLFLHFGRFLSCGQ